MAAASSQDRLSGICINILCEILMYSAYAYINLVSCVISTRDHWETYSAVCKSKDFVTLFEILHVFAELLDSSGEFNTKGLRRLGRKRIVSLTLQNICNFVGTPIFGQPAQVLKYPCDSNRMPRKG
jgi:hypothetical protein